MKINDKFKIWADSNKQTKPFAVVMASLAIIVGIAIFWVAITFIPFYALMSLLSWCFSWTLDFKFILGAYVLAALIMWMTRK